MDRYIDFICVMVYYIDTLKGGFGVEKQLELILKLRLELQKLSDVRNDAEKKYKDSEKNRNLSLEYYCKLKKEKDAINKLEEEYTDKKLIMSCLFTLPIGIVATIIFLLLNTNMPNTLFFNIMKCLISFISLSTVTMVSALLLNGICPEKVENILLKTFPSLKKGQNKINTYYNELVIEKDKNEQLKIETDKLYDEYISLDMLLSRKTRELLEQEEEYFYSLNIYSVEKKVDTVPINSEYKGKRRVKVLNSNENLEN